MPSLFLEPPSSSADAQASWAFALSGDGQNIERAGSSPVALLPKPGKSWDVALVLPIQDTSWHQAQLPQISLKDRARLRTVLQGLLEDQLLEDAAELHFSLAPDARPGQACWVAACRAERLQKYLAELGAQGIAVQRIVPAFAPGEHTDAPRLYAIGSEDAPWLAILPMDEAAGILALPLTSSVTALDAVGDTAAQVWAEPAVYQLAQQRLGQPVQLLAPGQRLLKAGASAWNLAQFQFANSGRDRLAQHTSAGLQALWLAPQWRWWRRGLVALVLAQIVGVQVWAWQARQDLARQRAQVQQLFTSTFPHVPVVIDAPLQMRQELTRLQQQSGALTPAAFEVLAGDAGAAMPEGVLPQEIRYENGRLTLGGLQQGDAQVTQWLAQLATQGLQAQWQDGALHLEPTKP